jgi:nicotinamide-nucleotide amidase
VSDPDDLPDEQVLGSVLHAELLRRHQVVATAESITGGALGDLLTASPGASETYLGGLVTYATEVKVHVLGVPQEVVDEHGVISAECATAMAERVRDLIGSDWGVSTTGVAGPTEQEGRPAGTVFIAVAGPDGSRSRELSLAGDRVQIRSQACTEASRLLLEAVTGEA